MKLKKIYIKSMNFLLSKFLRYKVVTVDQTIEELLKTKKSLIRFGDGELSILRGGNIGFQKSSEKLKARLAEILSLKSNDLMLAVPGPLGKEYSCLTNKAFKWWKQNIYHEKYYWHQYLHKDQIYYNALVSRFYVGVEKRDDSQRIIENLKLLWDDKKVLIVEGKYTKMGIGNDLFLKAKEIKRILCPPENAFDLYDEILKKTLVFARDFDFVLVSLGPAAKILVYDLYKQGVRAIDIGHVDNEYEWYLKGDHCRSAIKGKYVNEIAGGNIVNESDNEVLKKEIVCVID